MFECQEGPEGLGKVRRCGGRDRGVRGSSGIVLQVHLVCACARLPDMTSRLCFVGNPSIFAEADQVGTVRVLDRVPSHVIMVRACMYVYVSPKIGSGHGTNVGNGKVRLTLA